MIYLENIVTENLGCEFAAKGENGQPTRILEGIRILDMGAVVFGPMATSLLGDLGAEVIRVERSNGDVTRQYGPGRNPGMSPLYLSINRNKRSIALDLDKPADMEVMRGLVAKSDVFLHSVRTAGIERLGLGYEGCRTLNPEIIYAHCVGYGADGRYAGRMGYDAMMQGGAGIIHLMSMIEPNATPRYWPGLVIDKVLAYHAVYAVLAALFHRQRTGEGQSVEIAMFEAAAFFNLCEHMYGETMIPATGPIGFQFNLDPESRPYETKDGHICMFMSPRFWQEFCVWGGRDDLLEDPRMLAYGRGERVARIASVLEEITRTRTTEDWMEILEKAGIPCMRVATLDDVMADPHLNESNFFQVRNHPTEGQYRALAHPVSFRKTPAVIQRDAPQLNQDENYIRALALG